MTQGLSRRSLLAAPLTVAKRPNFVFVLVDDLRWDELGCTGHPFASTPHCDRLAREGALFENAFSVAPLCSPSRASFLTGQYPHTHGITDNVDRSGPSHKLRTWPARLHDFGYDTAFIGKWHMGNDASPRPGFSTWVSFEGQGESIDPQLNVNGRRTASTGYITDILTAHAVDFLQQSRTRPFCLYVSHKAIHPNIKQRDDGSVAGSLYGGGEDFIAAERHRDLYRGKTPPRRPNYAIPPKDKPALERQIGDLPPLGPATVTPDSVILNRMRMMKAVDEGLGRLLEALEAKGDLENTVVVFTSDHGYFYGEHGLSAERRLAYEENIRIPLLIRYPRRIKPGIKVPQFTLSIDIAPTMLGLAGAASGMSWQGRSLLPLFERRPENWRDDFLVEYYSDTVFPRILKMGYRAARGKGWKYIHYQDLEGMDELYNLELDPFEMRNLIHDPGSQALLKKAQTRLRELLALTHAPRD